MRTSSSPAASNSAIHPSSSFGMGYPSVRRHWLRVSANAPTRQRPARQLLWQSKLNEPCRQQTPRDGGLFLSFVIFDELFEIFHAFACERRYRLVAGPPNDEASIFRLHLRCELLQPFFGLAEHSGHTADGEDRTRGCHDQAA